MKAPSNCSYVWRKILKLRPLAYYLLKQTVGDGKFISFRHDNWTDGCLPFKEGQRRYGIPSTATTAEAYVTIAESQSQGRDEKDKIQRLLVNTQLNPNQQDKISWTASKTGKFTLASTCMF